MSKALPHRFSFVLILGLMAGLGPLCIDLYLPALPQLAGSLHIATASAQLSLTAGLLGPQQLQALDYNGKRYYVQSGHYYQRNIDGEYIEVPRPDGL